MRSEEKRVGDAQPMEGRAGWPGQKFVVRAPTAYEGLSDAKPLCCRATPTIRRRRIGAAPSASPYRKTPVANHLVPLCFMS